MPRGKRSDFYEVLEIDYDASYGEIKASYRRLRRQHAGDERRLKLVAEAWSVLSDEVSRKRYDQSIQVVKQRLQHRRPGKASTSPKPTSKTHGFARGEERIRKPLSDTEVISSRLSKTDVFPRIPDTQILSIEEPEPFRPLARTKILPANEDLDHQPASAPDMDDTVMRVPDENGVQTDILGKSPAILEVVFLDDTKKEYSLNKDKTTIGRRSDNDIVLEDPQMYISREHASIILRAGQYYVVDHDSDNGIFIRGKRIPANREIPLGAGETIEIEERKLTLRLETGS
ncbi:MAG: FHA domain-containing protein [Chloroflexi bacterium]|nr:FHA domain-containing protein [Chloroflexota bacterium]